MVLKRGNQMFLVVLCSLWYLFSNHYVFCQDITQNLKLSLRKDNSKDIRMIPLKKFACMSKTEGELAKKLSECISTDKFLKTVKKSAKDFLQDPSVDKNLVPFARCLGTMKYKSGDDSNNKKEFHKCLDDYNFESTLKGILLKEFTYTQVADYDDFMKCLKESKDDVEAQRDCEETHPIMSEIIDLLNRKAPIPYLLTEELKS